MCSLLIAALKASTGAAISYKSVRGDAVTSERSLGLDRPVCWRKFRPVAQIVPVVGASGCWGRRSRTPQAGAETRKMDSPVLGAGSLRSGCRQGWCLLRTVREGLCQAPPLGLWVTAIPSPVTTLPLHGLCVCRPSSSYKDTRQDG